MKEYLNLAMSANRSGSTQRVKWFADRFGRATELVVKALGPKPFHIRGPLNSSALDAVLCTVIENIEKVPPNLAERFAKLKEDKEFRDATFSGTSDVTVLQGRFKVAEQHLIQK